MPLKKMIKRIGKDKTIVLNIPDLPEGEVEIIILRKKDKILHTEKILSLLPRHHAGDVLGSLRREEIYSDAR